MRQTAAVLVFFCAGGAILAGCNFAARGDGRAAPVFNGDSAKKACCVPLTGICVLQHDGALGIPDTIVSDSFFIDAVNGLLAYEVSRYFSMVQDQGANAALPHADVSGFCSRLLKKRGDCSHAVESVRAIAAKTGADIIVVPLRCAIRQTTFQRDGWRKGKYEPAYGTPVSYAAEARFVVQIWSGEGSCLYEHAGRGTTGRPLSYSILERVGEDAAAGGASPFFYAPILVKALNEAIVSSLSGGRKGPE
jgi:hypothetical protein